jgi:hypothetical protein
MAWGENPPRATCFTSSLSEKRAPVIGKPSGRPLNYQNSRVSNTFPGCPGFPDNFAGDDAGHYTAAMARPTMSNPRAWAAGFFLAAFAAAIAPLAVAQPPAEIVATPALRPLVAQATRAGLRVLASRHLVLVTDRPPRDGDGLDQLPPIFDEAFTVWCRHFGLDPAAHADWQALGCLVVERDRFRAAGLLPDAVPDFTNGYCWLHRFWLADQSNADYRRHLLLHEGVHAFTTTLLQLDTPTWYTEGIAEFLATHRLAATAPRFQQTPIPAAATDAEQLGRIETIARLRAAGAAPSLEDVFRLRPTLHGTITSYASAWAAVAFLARHPRYAAVLAAAERGPLDAEFTARLTSHADWKADTARRDFDAFTADLDYGYDFDRMTIDWSPGKPVDAGTPPLRVVVRADRGWQNTGWGLRAGQQCRLRASGRCVVGAVGEPENPTVLESEADGISIDWYRGQPVGRLLAAQWDQTPAGSHRPTFKVLGTGADMTITAITNGPLFLRVNLQPGQQAVARRDLTVSLAIHD